MARRKATSRASQHRISAKQLKNKVPSLKAVQSAVKLVVPAATTAIPMRHKNGSKIIFPSQFSKQIDLNYTDAVSDRLRDVASILAIGADVRKLVPYITQAMVDTYIEAVLAFAEGTKKDINSKVYTLRSRHIQEAAVGLWNRTKPALYLETTLDLTKTEQANLELKRMEYEQKKLQNVMKRLNVDENTARAVLKQERKQKSGN